VFNTIEGGALACSVEDTKRKIDATLNFGITGPETVVYPGGNAKMNEFQAAMGLCNLRLAGEEIHKRKQVVERYNEHLSNIPGIRIVQPQKGVQSNYSYYPVLFDGYRYSRDEVVEMLKRHHIHARK